MDSSSERGFSKLRPVLLILALLTSAAPAAAQSPPQFQNISVFPVPFSPNGDGIADVLNVEYELSENADWVTVFVRDSAEGLVVKLLDGVPQSAGVLYHLAWNGKNESSALVPDGEYVIHFTAGNGGGQGTERTWNVSLDATAPSALITGIYPNPFTPDLPQSPDSVRVEMGVDFSSVDDSLTVAVAPKGQAPTDTLTLHPTFAGDGDYRAYWKGTAAPDGLYEILVTIDDAAGNHAADKSALSLDKSPPLVGILSPEDDAVFAGLPDSVFGRAYDRSGVRGVEISYDSRDYVGVPFFTVQDTVYWSAPLRDSLQGQGDHTVGARATDSPGHTGSGGDLGGPSSVTVTLDSVPPSEPTLDPLPSVVRSADLEVKGRASGAATVELYLNDMETPALSVPVSGSHTFSGGLELSPGDNRIAAAAVDAAGNRSAITTAAVVSFRLEFGVFFNERFRPGDFLEINLDEPALDVSVALYAMSGRLLRVLRAEGPSTNFQIAWDGRDGSGSNANNGVYLCRVTATLQNGSLVSDKVLLALVR
jgi:flagellar hook assembly protein FlgD